MTVTSATARADYNGSGSTGPFAYNFRIFTATDLLVTKRDSDGVETTLSYPTDFTITGVGAAAGGTTTLYTKLAVGEVLTLRRVLPLTQLINLRNQGATFPANLENGLDQGVMRAQQLENDIQGSVRLAETVDPTDFDTRLPANLSPGDAVVVNATGDGFSMAALSDAQLSAWNAAQNLTVDAFTSGFTPGVTTQLTLTHEPGGVNNVTVTMRVSGTVRMFERDEYSVSGTTLTFASPIPVGTTRVEVAYLYTYQVNTAASENVTYTQEGVGAVPYDVRTRLRGIATPEDFGAVGDGTTDDTAAIQAAIDTGKEVRFGAKTYKITAALELSQGSCCIGQVGNYSTGESGTVILCSANDWHFKAANDAASNTGIQLRRLKLLGDLGAAAGPGGVTLRGISGAILEDVLYSTLNGAGTSTGPAFRLQSVGGNGGLYNHFLRCIALRAAVGFQFLGTTNENVLLHCQARLCTTSVDMSGSVHNVFVGFDCEAGTDGIRMDSTTEETVFVGINFDTLSGTAYFDAGTGNYLIAPHFAACGTDTAGLTQALIADTVNGTQVPGDLNFTEFSGDSFARLRGPQNRQMRYMSRGNTTSTGHKFYTRDNAGTGDVERLFLPDATGSGSDEVDAKLSSGNLLINTIGKSVKIAGGANARIGTATLGAGGTAIVATTATPAGNRIFFCNIAPGGTPGFHWLSARTAGVGFTIQSSNAADRSTLCWVILEEA